MSNWIAITSTIVKTGKRVEILNAAQALATANSSGDPLPEIIADATAMLRAALSVGNALDVDTTKIPNSLKGLALRMITRRLKDYIEFPLTADELAQQKDDLSYVNRIIDDKIQFEQPDNAGGGGEMQQAGGLDQVSGGNLAGGIGVAQVFTRPSMRGL